jgi:peptidoglycan hydrolase-like protein with peptidoglycan-binding domain
MRRVPPSASLTIRVGGREVSRAEFTEVAEAKFSHQDGKDGRSHTVVCPGCSKSGHMQKAGSAKLAGGRTSHGFLCTNCGQSSTVINGPGEAIQSGGSEDNNPAPKMQEAEVSADHPSNCKLPHAKMAKRGRRVCPSCKAGLKLEEGVYVEAKHRRDHGKFAEKPGGKFQAKGRGGKIASTISGVGVARVKGLDKLRLANMMEPAPEATTIHIGLSSHAKDRMMRTSQEFSAGKTTTLNGHTSGSRAEKVAKQFGGGHILHLEVPKGHPIYEPAKHTNQFPAEQEVVIPHGSKVQVTRSVLKDGKHHHYGKLVGRSLQEANAAAAGWEAGFALEENKEGTSQAKAATPEPFSKSKTSNWIARLGGLPPYIQHIAHGIEERGKDRSAAIRTAIGVVKNWKDGKGNVDADTRAAAAKAWAQWTALKAKNAAKKVAGKLSEAEERDWTRLHALFESAEPVLLEEAEERELLEAVELHLEESELDLEEFGFKRGRGALQTDPRGKLAVGQEVRHGGLEGQVHEGVVTGFNKQSGDPWVKNHRTGIERKVSRRHITHLKKESGWAAWRARHAMAEAGIEESRNAPGPKGHRKAPETPEGVESAGERVAHLQRRLTSIGYELKPDGHFGPVTAAAVKEFQAGAMLKEDGIVGPKTTEALKGAPHPDEMAAAEQEGEPGVRRPELTDAEMLSDPPNPSAGAPSSAGGQAGSGQDVLFKGIAVGEKSGHKGVRQLQAGMGGLGYSVMTDGVFGPETEKVVKRFQRKYGLKPDGIVGEKTNRVLKTVGDRAKKLSEAVETRKAATGGREFSRALARERVLREALEEGFNAAVLVADALRQDPDATAVVAALLGERGEATALLEANAGLEALIAKLVAKGIPEDQAAAVAAKAISQGKGGSSAPKPGKRGKKAKVSAPKAGKSAGGVKMKRLPNGTFAPSGQGQVLTAGQAVSVPHKSKPGVMVPGTVKVVKHQATASGPESGATIELHDGPDKGKPFMAWAKQPSGGVGQGPDWKPADDPGDFEKNSPEAEAHDQAEAEKAGGFPTQGEGEPESDYSDRLGDYIDEKIAPELGMDPNHPAYSDVVSYAIDHYLSTGQGDDDPEKDHARLVDAITNLAANHSDDDAGPLLNVDGAEGEVEDIGSQDVWGGPEIGHKLKDKSGDEGEIVAHHDHASGDPEKKQFSVKHSHGTSKMGYGKLADVMAGKKDWPLSKKQQKLKGIEEKVAEQYGMDAADVKIGGKLSRGEITPDDVPDDKIDAVLGYLDKSIEANKDSQVIVVANKVKQLEAHREALQARKGEGGSPAGKTDETADDHVGETSPTGHDLAASPGRGPTGKLRNFKAMGPEKLKKTIADLEDFGGDPEALAAVKKVAQEKGVAWAEGKSATPKPKPQVGDVAGWAAAAQLGAKTGGPHKGAGSAPAKPGDAKAEPPQYGTVHKALKQVANGKTASMSSKRKQDLVSRGFAKWDGPGELSLTDKGNEMIGKSQGSKSGGGFTPEQMEKAGKAAKAAGAPKSKLAAASKPKTADKDVPLPKFGTDTSDTGHGAPLGQSATPSPPEEMGVAGEMGPNTGNLSLKDMPLGTTFQMNDGKEYVLHKFVNDPYMIVKDAQTGKGKPLHKMLAPPQVGPIAPGYEGAGGPGPSAPAAAAAPEDPDALFNKLSASVDVAKAAKASGADPAEAFKAAPPAAAAPAPKADDPAASAALKAYRDSGGKDPAVIKALGG